MKEFVIGEKKIPKLNAKFGLKLDGRGLASKKGRLDFETAVKNKLPVGLGMARCHSFSQDFIAAILQNIIDLAIGNPQARDEIYEMLYGLGNMIFGSGGNSEEKEVYLSSIEYIFSISLPRDAADFANVLMGQLNNSMYNLRAGNACWNSSISYSFDPVSWDCVIVGNDGNAYMISEKSIVPIPDDSGRKQGIYLTDSRDAGRLQSFMELRDYIEDDYSFGIDIYSVQLENGVYGIVGSSSNSFVKNKQYKPVRYNDIFINCNGMWQSIL